MLTKIQISPPGPLVGEKQMDYWVAMMKDQEMLRPDLKVAQLLNK